MTDDRLTFRTGMADDAEAIMEVLEAFDRGERGTDAWVVRQQSIVADAAQWRVGVLDGQIVSAVHVPAGAVWFGRSRVTWADVGEVSVRPGLQGRGIGTAAMYDAVAWQVERGISASRLGGQIRFYRRAGYEPFPRQYIEFPIPDTIAMGASQVALAEWLAPENDEIDCVRPVELPEDAEAISEVMTAHNRHRSGCRVLDQPLTSVLRGKQSIVYEEAGKVCGCAFFATYKHDGGAFEGGLSAYLMTYRPDCVPALRAMIRHLLRHAQQAGIRRMTVLLPPDAATLRDLPTVGVNYNVCQEYGRIAGSMIRVISLRQLLTDIAEELRRRVEPIGWRGRVRFDIGDEQVDLHIEHGAVPLRADGDDADVTLELTHAEMLRTVLGVMPPVWTEQVRADHPAYAALAAMFPPTVGGFNT